MVWVKARSVKWDMFIPWGLEDFAVDTTSERSREGVECSFGEQTSKVNKNWEGRRRGLVARFQQR